MKITPFVLGSGRAGQAAAKALASLGIQEPALGIGPVTWVPRGADLASFASAGENPVLIISNPHGLHSASILAAERAGFRCIFTEKPSCVNAAQAAELRSVRATVGVFHVYRQTWGVQTLRSWVEDGRFGEIISVEGRYWQASTAERALKGDAAPQKSWKNELALSGESDTLLDVGTHWIDAAGFVIGKPLARISGWKSYANAEAPHRDTHVHATLEFQGGARALGSISKTVHGASNRFELVVIGTRQSASWNFLEPDEILVGSGRDREVITRKSTELGSGQPAFHGLGWVEGYVEILRQGLTEAFLGKKGRYPRLADNLALMEKLFASDLWSLRS